MLGGNTIARAKTYDSRRRITKVKESISQLAILTAALGLFPGTFGAFAQHAVDIQRDASHLDDLVNTGRYGEAANLTKSILDRLHAWQQDDAAPVFLAYLSKAALETGHPEQASTLLKSAEGVLSRARDNHYEPSLVREKAALSYAAGEYAAAAELSGKAYRLSVEQNYYKIRAEYCHSIQALALLRMGNVREAERLAMNAAKAVPGKHPNHPVFAPRILYSACIVSAHAGRKADAEAFCRRGLDAASTGNRETRDLSVGYLAVAEYHLKTGDQARSREAALKAVDITRRLFGTRHQDMVEALVILATLDKEEGDHEAARGRVNEAAKIAAALFGEGSPVAALPGRVLLPEARSEP